MRAAAPRTFAAPADRTRRDSAGAVLVFALLLAGLACAEPAPPAEPDFEVTAYAGGRVWDGVAFERRALYVRGGEIVAEPPGGAGTTVELGGGFVVPPYADAHQHVTSPNRASSDDFLRRGTFYALNPNTVVDPFAGKLDFFARPETYDVILSMGGITEPGGHPERLYVDLLSRWVYTGWPKERFYGNAFHFVAGEDEIAPVLDRLEAQGSEIVKTYLLFSEEYEERLGKEEFFGQRGLDPELYPVLVEAIHARGLPVAVHVETPHDVEVAARAGVDLFVHVPAHATLDVELERYRMSPEVIAAVRASGAPVVPTYSLARSRYEGPGQDAARAAHYALQKENVDALQAAGVPILIGTDAFRASPIVEARHLHEIGALTRAEAVAALTGTAAHLFPDRRLSCLAPGCEADFLVLAADPTADLAALESIVRWVKAGRELDLEPEPPRPGEEAIDRMGASLPRHGAR